AYKTGNLKLKAQFGMTEGDVSDEERSLWALGADYTIGKNSKVYAFLSEVEEDLSEDKDTTFGIGFDHNFSM
ncbi:porin, partial [Marinobacter sp.]|uniref:porin n=1 Tax=Marinobacter sp. TaxID=50741 RepID=UPI001A065B66